LSGSNASWLRRITSSWQENTITWNNQPSTTTFNEVNIPAHTTPQQDYVLDVTAAIQGMVDTPSANFGFMIMLQTEQFYRALLFATSDHPNSAVHPKLEICYTVPCTTLVLQPNAAAGKDAYLNSLTPNVNGGTVEDFDAEAWTNGGNPVVLRSSIEFDLSSVPAGTTITSANLTLYFNPTSLNGSDHSQLSGSNASWLRRITSSWQENTITWNNQPSTTTYNEVNIPAHTTPQQDYVLDVTAAIQGMVDTPSANFGFMIMLQTEQFYRALLFATSDHPNSAVHPKLEICYASSIGVAEIFGEGQINIYPNPSNGTFAIQFKNSLKNGTIEVFNSLGQQVYVRNISGSAKEVIDLNAAAGIYFVKIFNGEKIITQKLVIN
jgi:hypothetical protein